MDKRDYMRQWYLSHKEHIRAYREKTRAKRNADRRKEYRQSPALRRKLITNAMAYKRKHPLQWTATKFGISVERLEQLWDRGCAICGAGWASAVKLHADHDHSTGKFRGVLCESCNLGLGKFYNDPLALAAAADYILAGGSQ